MKMKDSVNNFWEEVEVCFAECRKLTGQRGADYGRDAYGALVPNYFPAGNASYMSVCWLKMMRLRSMTLSPGDADRPKLLDSIYDQINYLSFWAADLQTQARKAAERKSL